MSSQNTMPTKSSFLGVVYLKEFMGEHIGFAGMVSVVEAKTVLGFDTHDRESNWFAEICGAIETVIIPGCQVRGVHKNAKTVGLGVRVLVLT